MKSKSSRHVANDRSFRMKRSAGITTLSCAALLGILTLSIAPNAFAAEAQVNLGTAESYSVLGGQAVTNTGGTFLQGDLGVSPGTSVTGFSPGQVLGKTHINDANANLAQSDLTKAYDDAASRAPTEIISGDLVGKTLVSGVYKSDSTLDLNGTVTLDAQGDPSAVWIFQVGSALTTGSSSYVELTNGASACNIYWQVGSSATIGTGSDFKGSILALTSISVTTNSVVEGRALARNGAVTLDSNVFMNPICPDPTPAPTVTTPAPTPTPTPTGTTTPTAPPTGTPTAGPGTPTPTTPAPEPTTPSSPAPSTPPSGEPTAPVTEPTIVPEPAEDTTAPPTQPAVNAPPVTSPDDSTGANGLSAGSDTEDGSAVSTEIGTGVDEADGGIADTSAEESGSNENLADTGAKVTFLALLSLTLAVLGSVFMINSYRTNRTQRLH